MKKFMVNPWPVSLCIVTSHAEMKRVTAARPDVFKPIEKGTAGCAFDLTAIDGTVVMFLDGAYMRTQPLPDVLGYLVHECTHTWQFIRDYTGETKPSSQGRGLHHAVPGNHLLEHCAQVHLECAV